MIWWSKLVLKVTSQVIVYAELVPQGYFQAGVECKLVREVTGHKSDAIDQYQVTSDLQREELSKIISDRGNRCLSVPKVGELEEKLVKKDINPEMSLKISVSDQANIACHVTRKFLNWRNRQSQSHDQWIIVKQKVQ